MTDPIAEAAAQLNQPQDAAPSSTEPSLLEKAMETIHELEEKVEHLIHPEAVEPQSAAGESSSASTVDQSASLSTETSSRSTSPSLPDQAPGSADSGSAEPIVDTQASTLAPEVAGGQTGELIASTSLGESPSSPLDPKASASESLTGQAIPISGTLDVPPAYGDPNAAPAATGELSEASASAAADLPNAAASPAAEPLASVTESSAQPASPAIAEPIPGAHASAIREHLSAIKSHLSIKGFEASTVAFIHDEMASIEGYL